MTELEIMSMRYRVKKGYAIVKLSGHPLADRQGLIRRNRLMYWECVGEFDPALVVHHKDNSRLNDTPENLQCLPWGDHTSGHLIGNRFGTANKGRTVTWGDKISDAGKSCSVCGKQGSDRRRHARHLVKWGLTLTEQVA